MDTCEGQDFQNSEKRVSKTIEKKLDKKCGTNWARVFSLEFLFLQFVSIKFCYDLKNLRAFFFFFFFLSVQL